MANIILPSSLGSGPTPIQTEHRFPVWIDKDNAPNLAFLMRAAAIADPAVPVTVYIKASVWSALVRELASQPDELWMDPSRKPTPETFKSLALTKKFTIVNAGTDDDKWIDERNAEAQRYCSFEGRREHLRISTADRAETERKVDDALDSADVREPA